MFDDTVLAAARSVLDSCRSRRLLVATAESCTGGLIIGALTEIAGSSDVVERGFVTYSNEAKVAMLGVPRELIERDGAVSEVVARAMADGALVHSAADLTVSVTGIAGPGGGSAEKPVGLVHFGCAARTIGVRHKERRFGDLGRTEIRRLTVLTALAFLDEMAGAASFGAA
jgi:nicotinamide-nucleotide amidase